MRRGNLFIFILFYLYVRSRLSVCLSVCPSHVLTFESVDVEFSYLPERDYVCLFALLYYILLKLGLITMSSQH